MKIYTWSQVLFTEWVSQFQDVLNRSLYKYQTLSKHNITYTHIPFFKHGKAYMYHQILNVSVSLIQCKKLLVINVISGSQKRRKRPGVWTRGLNTVMQCRFQLSISSGMKTYLKWNWEQVFTHPSSVNQFKGSAPNQVKQLRHKHLIYLINPWYYTRDYMGGPPPNSIPIS